VTARRAGFGSARRYWPAATLPGCTVPRARRDRRRTGPAGRSGLGLRACPPQGCLVSAGQA